MKHHSVTERHPVTTTRPFMFSKRVIGEYAPYLTPIEGNFNDFRAAWEYAIDLFKTLDLTIVGCHYDDDALEPSAEFFVVGRGIHETYVIRR